VQILRSHKLYTLPSSTDTTHNASLAPKGSTFLGSPATCTLAADAKVGRIASLFSAAEALLSGHFRCPHYRGRHGPHGPVDDDHAIPFQISTFRVCSARAFVRKAGAKKGTTTSARSGCTTPPTLMDQKWCGPMTWARPRIGSFWNISRTGRFGCWSRTNLLPGWSRTLRRCLLAHCNNQPRLSTGTPISLQSNHSDNGLCSSILSRAVSCY
jgi:hypothetical protein